MTGRSTFSRPRNRRLADALLRNAGGMSGHVGSQPMRKFMSIKRSRRILVTVFVLLLLMACGGMFHELFAM